MSWTFVACVLIAFAWMALFFLWGRAFLTYIKVEYDISSSIVFGYLVLQIIYQGIYLPFYLARGSYRATAWIWIGIVSIISVFLLIYVMNHRMNHHLKKNEKIGVFIAGILVLGLAVYISLHVPFYGADTRDYIARMNDFIYKDSMWITSGTLSFHYGMSSMFEFFTLPSLFTGIKPYYISLFTVRILGICLFSLIAYRTGTIVFGKKGNHISWSAVVLAVLVPYLLMLWGSNYTAEFFYWRINEAKGYCQFVLLSLAFSVFLAMFREDSDRKALWKEQLLIGLAAVPVSGSSLTSYIFLVFLSVCSLLVYEKFKEGWRTIKYSVICAVPNLCYLLIYFLETQGIIVL